MNVKSLVFILERHYRTALSAHHPVYSWHMILAHIKFKIVSSALVNLSLLTLTAVGVAASAAELRLPPLTDSLNVDISAGTQALDLFEIVPGTVVGTELIRVTAPNSESASKLGDRHQYSRRQVWSANETMMLFGQKILNADTFETAVDDLKVSSASVWSNTQPNVIYGMRYNPNLNEFVAWDVVEGEIEVIWRFDEYHNCRLGDGEGNLSNDDSLIVFSCRKENSRQAELLAFDTKKKRILGQISAKDNFNWASFSQSGRYILVENNDMGAPERELIRYEPDFSEPFLLTNQTEHGDFGFDINGDDVFVMLDLRQINYIRLSDGEIGKIPLTRLLDSIGYGHVSCRNINRPGWCFFSTSGNGVLASVQIGSDYGVYPILATVKHVVGISKKNFQIWGQHYSTSSSYESQPKASVNPSGTAIVFTSDWGGESPASDYITRISAQ